MSANFKRGELVAEAGSLILSEGTHSAQLFTLLSGWAFRYKTLPDGRRQILNYVLPGDLIGLQGSVIGEMQHSVEALSPVVLCVFQRTGLPDLYRNHPGLAFDITWLAAREERMLDENLLSVGPAQRHRAGGLPHRLHLPARGRCRARDNAGGC